MDSWILRTFMQLKNLSNISQYFPILAVSGCPYSLRATPTYVVKTYAARQIFIAKNSVKFICWVVILRHNCNPSSKSFKIKSLMWLQVKQYSVFHRRRENILSKPEFIRSLRPVLTKSGWSQKNLKQIGFYWFFVLYTMFCSSLLETMKCFLSFYIWHIVRYAEASFDTTTMNFGFHLSSRTPAAF